MNVLWAERKTTSFKPRNATLNITLLPQLTQKRCACGKHAPSEDQAALNTRHMEAPPREKRARAAFFREKDAKRAAKQQRKKDKLTEKISHGGATEKDVAPNVAQRSTYRLEPSSRSNPSPANANSGPVHFGRFESCSPCPAHPTATQWSVSALWLVVPRCGRVVRAGSPRPRRGPAFRRCRAYPRA